MEYIDRTSNVLRAREKTSTGTVFGCWRDRPRWHSTTLHACGRLIDQMKLGLAELTKIYFQRKSLKPFRTEIGQKAS